ncbi:MAG: alpha/beta hydrolase family protein [Alphaproteobacteria bacterium]|jgi:dienelactone hydrolase|nr:alpha/beta hydrolase family protein [Alphaproteobacteria bacterium]MDP6816668.1 alpha/beta hydrolase family protein [Alphaproteobacteria bacterium]
MPLPVSLHVKTLAVKRRIARLLGGADDPYPVPPGDVCLSPSECHIHDYDDVPLRLSWRNGGERNAAEWQHAAGAKLAELSGYSRPERCPRARHEQSHGLPGNLIRKSCYLSAGAARDIPIHVIFNPSLKQRLPVMICLQGTNSGIHLSWGEVRLPIDVERIQRGAPNALQAASRGYMAVAVEQACFGERRERRIAKPSPDPCIDAANHALLLGRTLLGERVSDISAVINWLESGAHGMALDLARLHIMGNSSGGTTALFSAALDKRITAALLGGCVGYFRDTIARRADSSGQNVIPGILNWLEIDDVLALAAPIPVLLFAGREDHIWPYAGAEAVAESARAVYRELGAPDRLRAAPAEGGHSYHPDVAWPAFEALLSETA